MYNCKAATTGYYTLRAVFIEKMEDRRISTWKRIERYHVPGAERRLAERNKTDLKLLGFLVVSRGYNEVDVRLF